MALNSVCEDIRQLLDTGSKGTQGTDLFSFQWGSGVNGVEVGKQIVVIDTGTIKSPLKANHEQPTFLILVRGDPNEVVSAVHDRARDIYEYLIGLPKTTINTVEYLEFEPQVGLLPLGKDENNRFVFSMNFYTFRCSV